MARWLMTGSLMAGGLLSGCSGMDHQACDDCLPPKSKSKHYEPCFDNMVTKHTATKCAKGDLKDYCGGKSSKDFKDGFTQAYIDLAMGRYAVVPPIPPAKYWHAYYRSYAGQEDVNDWFAGYRAGLDAGYQGGVSRFNRIATSSLGDCGPQGCDVMPMSPGYSGLPAHGAPLISPVGDYRTGNIAPPLTPSTDEIRRARLREVLPAAYEKTY